MNVGLQFGLDGCFGNGADDKAAGLVGRQHLAQHVAQVLPPGLVLDPLRDADVRVLRQVDQQAPRDRDLCRQPRALGADRILDHLHHQRLALGEDSLYRFRLRAILALLPDVGHVQERGALQADLDERRLHSRQHARHLADIDISDHAARLGALDVQLLDDAARDHGDTRLLRRHVDEDIFRHAGGSPAKRLISSAVSYSGSPITPE